MLFYISLTITSDYSIGSIIFESAKLHNTFLIVQNELSTLTCKKKLEL